MLRTTQFSPPSYMDVRIFNDDSPNTDKTKHCKQWFGGLSWVLTLVAVVSTGREQPSTTANKSGGEEGERERETQPSILDNPFPHVGTR
ncbi:hypothetical protein PR048_023482 [Dryococelus australis]|uniref:Uncharacterized protein n=1 Tax=Dryococelus australis TaxID=614101 RepID=A0ABQ9GUA9_9NEOP|nr:hypothetical protein PR048_023482 [Dryococelus australis]